MTDILHAPTSADRTSTQAPAAAEQVPLIGERKEPPPGRITWEEFLAWTDEDTHAEWVDGEVVVLSPSNLVHLDLIKFLYEILARFVRAKGLGQVYFMGLLMKLTSRPSGREPDLVFVTKEHAARLRNTFLDGPADLAVEVVSSDSDARDRSDKFREYEAAGIPEYWLLDPIRREALFYRLGGDGRYHLSPTDAGGRYHSLTVPGFALRVAWLWQQPLPYDEAARELGV